MGDREAERQRGREAERQRGRERARDTGMSVPPPHPKLTADQIRFFKTEGYLILPRVVEEHLLAAARDLFWELAEPEVPWLNRDDPATWLRRPVAYDENNGDGPYLTVFGDTQHTETDDTPLPSRVAKRGMRLFCRSADTTRAPQLMALLRDNSAVKAIARQLLGDGIVGFDDKISADPGIPAGEGCGDDTRGIYATLPQGDSPELREPFVGAELHGEGGPGTLEKHQRVHFDGCADERRRLGVVTYLDDVPPGGGSFLLWPRSHTRMHKLIWHTEGMEHRFDKSGVGPVHPETVRVRKCIDEIVRDTQPVDCHGDRGTLVLWHHRMLHMGGQNFSTDTIRKAVIVDFSKTEEAVPPELLDTSKADLWRDWSQELRDTAVASDVPLPPVGGREANTEPAAMARQQAERLTASRTSAPRL